MCNCRIVRDSPGSTTMRAGLNSFEARRRIHLHNLRSVFAFQHVNTGLYPRIMRDRPRTSESQVGTAEIARSIKEIGEKIESLDGIGVCR
jgi:hypothetical protein